MCTCNTSHHMSRVASLPRANRMVSRWFRGGFARFRAGFALISRGFAPVSRMISRGFALVSRGFARFRAGFANGFALVSRSFARFRKVSQASAYIASQGIARYRKVSQGFAGFRKLSHTTAYIYVPECCNVAHNASCRTSAVVLCARASRAVGCVTAGIRSASSPLLPSSPSSLLLTPPSPSLCNTVTISSS